MGETLHARSVQGFNNLAGDCGKDSLGKVILRSLSRYEAYEEIALLAARSNRSSKLRSGSLRADGQRRFAGVDRRCPRKYRLFSMPQSGGIAGREYHGIIAEAALSLLSYGSDRESKRADDRVS